MQEWKVLAAGEVKHLSHAPSTSLGWTRARGVNGTPSPKAKSGLSRRCLGPAGSRTSQVLLAEARCWRSWRWEKDCSVGGERVQQRRLAAQEVIRRSFNRERQLEAEEMIETIQSCFTIHLARA
jgi:hypothetical protein